MILLIIYHLSVLILLSIVYFEFRRLYCKIKYSFPTVKNYYYSLTVIVFIVPCNIKMSKSYWRKSMATCPVLKDMPAHSNSVIADTRLSMCFGIEIYYNFKSIFYLKNI